MVAKTFDKERDFDLSERYDALIERLTQIDYGTIPASVVLQTIAGILVKQVGKKEILKLNRKKFIDAWEPMCDAVERADLPRLNGFRVSRKPRACVLSTEEIATPLLT